MHKTLFTGLALLSLFACNSADGSKTPTQPAATTNTVAPAEAATNSLPETVATVNGEAITLTDLNKAAAAAVIAAEVKVYEARQQALEKLITDKLLEAAAKKQNLDVEAFLKQEVEDKAPMPTDAEIEAFYNARRDQMPQPLEQMKGQLVNYLMNEKRRDTFMALIDGLKKEGKVENNLPPYRVTIGAGTGHRKGSATAPVQIIEFSDFQCPYCTRGVTVVEEVLAHYGDKVSVVFRHFPLSFHQDAHLAAQAAECAGDQGKFWEYHDLLFENQKAGMKRPQLGDYAKQLKLDDAKFASCVDGGTHAGKVDNDMEEGALVGMNGTPGFYINGIPLTGAVPFENFKQVIDAELARKGM